MYSTSVCLLHLDMYGKGYISKKYIYLGSQENREVGHPNFQNTVQRQAELLRSATARIQTLRTWTVTQTRPLTHCKTTMTSSLLTTSMDLLVGWCSVVTEKLNFQPCIEKKKHCLSFHSVSSVLPLFQCEIFFCCSCILNIKANLGINYSTTI